MPDPPRTPSPRVISLPGFLSEEPLGLGDAIKRATSSAGIRPCGGCAQRAVHLNQWVAFSGRLPVTGRRD